MINIFHASRIHDGFRAFCLTHLKCNKFWQKPLVTKPIEREMFLESLHFVEELESIKTHLGPESDTQLKELITECVDVTRVPQGLPPHRITFDNKTRVAAYPKRHRRNRIYAPENEEFKRQYTDFLKQGLVRVSNSPYVAPNVMVRKLDGSIRVCVDYIALNESNVNKDYANSSVCV